MFTIQWVQISSEHRLTYNFSYAGLAQTMYELLPTVADDLMFLDNYTESYIFLAQGDKLILPCLASFPTMRVDGTATAPIDQQQTSHKSVAASVGTQQTPFTSQLVVTQAWDSAIPFNIYISSRYYGSYSWSRHDTTAVEVYHDPTYNAWSW